MWDEAPVSRYQSVLGGDGCCCCTIMLLSAAMRAFWSHAEVEDGGGGAGAGAGLLSGCGGIAGYHAVGGAVLWCVAEPANGAAPPGRGPRMPEPGAWGRHGIGQACTMLVHGAGGGAAG